MARKSKQPKQAISFLNLLHWLRSGRNNILQYGISNEICNNSQRTANAKSIVIQAKGSAHTLAPEQVVSRDTFFHIRGVFYFYFRLGSCPTNIKIHIKYMYSYQQV
jgi:hypothetical protein